VLIEDDGSSVEPLVGTNGEPARMQMKPTLFDSLGEKAGDIVTQIAAVTARLNRVLDEKNAQNLARTLDNVAMASDGLREMPAVMAAVKEALSERNLKTLRQILVQVEQTAGEAAPLAGEMRELVKAMSGLAKRFDQMAGGASDELTGTTLPRANALMDDLAASSRQLSRILDGLESNPQMLLFGREGARPGPGESGFAVPKQGESK
jgi:phospholipid/cholesterol/gamma-HCH transport system substrate-binding protein